MNKVNISILKGKFIFNGTNDDIANHHYEFNDLQINAIKLYTNNGDVLLSLYLRANKRFTFQLYYYYMTHIFIQKTLGMDFSIKNIEKFYQTLKSCFIYSFDHDVILYRGISTILSNVK